MFGIYKKIDAKILAISRRYGWKFPFLSLNRFESENRNIIGSKFVKLSIKKVNLTSLVNYCTDFEVSKGP